MHQVVATSLPSSWRWFNEPCDESGLRPYRLPCRLLSDRARSNLESASTKPCVRALGQLHLTAHTVGKVQVWGDSGQARLTSGALFLAQFTTGWKVTAAGCEPRQDMPYDCVVEG